MTYEKATVSRRITVERIMNTPPDEPQGEPQSEPKPLSAEELSRIARAYGEKAVTEEEAKKRTIASYSGTFTGTMPGDVGGDGTFEYYSSQLGTTSIYCEEFRGNPQPGVLLDHNFTALDAISRHLTVWLRTEFGDYADYPKLEKFVKRFFSTTAKDLITYIWVVNNSQRFARSDPAGEALTEDHVLRFMKCFLSQGYLSLTDLVSLKSAIRDPSMLDLLKDIFRRVLTKKAHIEDSAFIKALVAFVFDEKATRTSLAAYLKTTDAFPQLPEKAREEILADRNHTSEVFAEFLKHTGNELSIRPRLFEENDELEVSFTMPVEPIRTNGTWDAEKKCVTWSHKIDETLEKGSRLPALCYAVWSEPDAAFQKTWFGGVKLTGGNLFEYCLWYNGLTAENREKWDRWMRKLSAEDDLSEKLDQAPRGSPFKYAADLLKKLLLDEPSKS